MNEKYPKTKGLALSASFAVFLGICSFVSIPLPTPMPPLTLQVLGVFLIAALLGPSYGTLSCLIYLMLGALGLPFFHGGSYGLGVLLGPTGGYLFAFPIAVLIGGSISRTVGKTMKMDTVKVSAGVAAALVIIYLLGPAWLMVFYHLTPLQAFIAGIVPFIGFDILKGVVVVPIVVRLRSTRFDLPVSRRAIKLRDSSMISAPKENIP
ncbi:MAG: biotin transporter BioY [Nitrososphaerales archaeon]